MTLLLRIFHRTLCFGLAIMLSVSAHAQAVNDAEFKTLADQVQTRLDELKGLIADAKSKGVDTDYANVSVETIQAFQSAANWDHNNVEEVRRLFKTFRNYKKTDPGEADRLASNEMNACLEVADHAIEQLRQQIAGDVKLTASPDFSKGELQLGTGWYRLDDHVVFPYTIFWLPREGSNMADALGRVGEMYFAVSMMQPDGSVNPKDLKRRAKSAKAQSKANFAPLYHFWGHIPAAWMKKQHPQAMLGGRRFTQYDIDSPLVRDWVKKLCEGFLPPVAKAYGDGPMLYLLANEPHFATADRGWLVKNGLSDFSDTKYRVWLEAKYGQIGELNEIYQTGYKDFAAVDNPFPIPNKLRGGPVWYDWCRFNMDRVNDWFTFLKQTSTAAVSDLRSSPVPVTIKMLGHHLVDGQRDHGMDIEYLMSLQDVTGGDLRIQPWDATVYAHLEGGLDAKEAWTTRYSYDWVGQAMFLDFARSMAPEKAFFDSEWHGFGAVHWRHFKLDRKYVRASLWQAFSNGMGMIEPWMWGRLPDGSMRKQADQIGELATQPIAVDAYGRTMKELNAFADVFAAAAVPEKRRYMLFYCEESAIQHSAYADELASTYEALKLLNDTVGLTTPTHAATLDASEQVIIVPPTPFISDASLKSLSDYEASGGKIVVVGSDHCFGKTEHGQNRSGGSGLNPVASVSFGESWPMADELEKVLKPFASKQPIAVKVTDTDGDKAWGAFVLHSTDPISGERYIILNNAAREPRTVTIDVGEGGNGLLDAITGQPVDRTISLGEYDVRLVKIMP